MATNHDDNFDPLRNPTVDFERSDLSAKGVLLFLLGLLLCGVFVELVIWGMFRYMGSSQELFEKGRQNPMMSQQKALPQNNRTSVLQNTPPVNVDLFPEPRLQANDAGDMDEFLQSEQKVLDPQQPFTDSTGAIHISIDQAMKLIAERGLPMRSSSPAPDFSKAESQQKSNPAASPAGPGR